MAKQSGLGGHRQPSLPLIEVRQQHREPVTELGQQLLADRHTTPTSRKIENNTLIFYGFDETNTGSGYWPGNTR
jgi:hypothetical protein